MGMVLKNWLVAVLMKPQPGKLKPWDVRFSKCWYSRKFVRLRARKMESDSPFAFFFSFHLLFCALILRTLMESNFYFFLFPIFSDGDFPQTPIRVHFFIFFSKKNKCLNSSNPIPSKKTKILKSHKVKYKIMENSIRGGKKG